MFKSNANAQAWTQVTFNMSSFAGQTVVLWFNVHQDASTPRPDVDVSRRRVPERIRADGAGRSDGSGGDGGERVGVGELDGAVERAGVR